MATKIKLNNVRLSFPSLFKLSKFKNEDGSFTDGKFEATFLIHKDDQADLIAKIEKEADAFLVEKFGNKEKVPKALKRTAFKDGDTFDYDGYENHMAFKGGSNGRVTVIDRDKTPLAQEDGVLYAGCYVHALVSFWYSEHPLGGKQLLANLHGVQFFRAGEAFCEHGGDCSDEFDAFEDDSLDGDDDEDEF